LSAQQWASSAGVYRILKFGMPIDALLVLDDTIWKSTRELTAGIQCYREYAQWCLQPRLV
jgi:hypothetical protein